MLFRIRVMGDTVDSRAKAFQASGAIEETPRAEIERLAKELEAGAAARFYRGGQPHGRVVTARATADGLWLKIRITARDPEIWRLVETGAVNTIELQVLPRGVDVFLKSVAATYPAAMA
ncbi:MAG: hypothetical protein ACT4PE_11920 [Candidatus Eiseniibacteriota bacterium]